MSLFKVNSPMIVSFAGCTKQDYEQHMLRSRYGNFELTGAIRPAMSLEVVPRQGYRFDQYNDENASIPVLMAAVSKEHLFEVFMDMVPMIGQEVGLILETSHEHGNERRDGERHTDIIRHEIETPILQSLLWDYEDLLMNDGCTGIAVVNESRPAEVQFNEHKILCVYYSGSFQECETILHEHGVRRDDTLRFITEAEHAHLSSDKYAEEFDKMCAAFNVDGKL